MKQKILKVIRILITTLMVLSVLAVSVLPVGASPPTFDDRDLFPPFHMALEGYVYDYIDSQITHDFLLPLPNLGYDFYGSTFSESYATYYDDNFDIVADISVGQSDLRNQETILDPILFYNFYLSSAERISSKFTLWLKAGFLSPEFSFWSQNDGGVFTALDDPSGAGGKPLLMDFVGEFYVGEDPYETYDSKADDILCFVSYYQVLYYSNFPFMDKFPSRLDRDVWLERYRLLEGADFSNLTSDQLQACQYCFDWVGPVFGTFSLSFYSDSYFYFYYLLTDRDVVNRIYETVLEESAYSGYTGFERVTHFLGSAVQGFFSVEILPDFSLGSILVVIIAFSLVLWWLKVFAGG